jgi:hypothetical protein
VIENPSVAYSLSAPLEFIQIPEVNGKTIEEQMSGRQLTMKLKDGYPGRGSSHGLADKEEAGV